MHIYCKFLYVIVIFIIKIIKLIFVLNIEIYQIQLFFSQRLYKNINLMFNKLKKQNIIMKRITRFLFNNIIFFMFLIVKYIWQLKLLK